MSKKFPQSPESFNFDGLALKNLEIYFHSTGFVFSSIRSVYSGREYGIDWVVEILEGESNTGIKFFVQSKTTENMINGDYLNIQIDTKNINYLMNQTTPVFIHVYHRGLNKGYFLWLQEWYATHYSPKWKEQESVTIKIPINKELSDKVVSEIRRIVLDQHTKSMVRQEVDLFNQFNEDLRFSSPEFIANQIVTIANPLKDNVAFSITVDEQVNQAIKKSIDEGYSIEFPILSTDMPSPFGSLLDSDSEWRVTMIPAHTQESLDFGISFFDGDNQIILEEQSVTFTKIRAGRIEEEWIGKSVSNPIVYNLKLNDETKTIEFTFSCNDSQNPIAMKLYYPTYQKLATSSSYTIVKAKSNNQLSFKFDKGSLPILSDEEIRIIEAAYNLKAIHNYDIKLIPPFNSETLFYFELASQLLTHKKSFWVIQPNQKLWKTKIRNLKQIISHIKENGFILVKATESHDITLTFGDIKVALGEVRSIFYIYELKNINELEVLANSDKNAENLVEIEIKVDMEKSFTILEVESSTHLSTSIIISIVDNGDQNR